MKNLTLIERDFKLRFGVKFCLLTIIGMLALTLFIFFVTSENLDGSYRNAIVTIYKLKINIFPLLFSSFYSIVILVVITAAMVVISTLFSHKMAGPMVHLEKGLEVIGSGDLTYSSRLRKGDQLTAISEEMNSMVRSLNHKVRSSREALEKVKRHEEALKSLCTQPGPDALRVREALNVLRASMADLKRSTSGFKLS